MWYCQNSWKCFQISLAKSFIVTLKLYFKTLYFSAIQRGLKQPTVKNTIKLTANTELFKMIVGILTTCHTQYTLDSSIHIFFI